MKSKGLIEVFTRGCSSCEPTVTYANELASSGQCELRIWDVTAERESAECRARIQRYGIHELPAIAVDGQLLACCS